MGTPYPDEGDKIMERPIDGDIEWGGSTILALNIDLCGVRDAHFPADRLLPFPRRRMRLFLEALDQALVAWWLGGFVSFLPR